MERFAGAECTYTIEAMMQNGWALQAGTSHFLGQSFAKAFEVFFQSEDNKRELVWATSWGVSTRLMGALIMTHSDDKGVILPPKIAPEQVVIIPIITGKADIDDQVLKRCNELYDQLLAANVRVKVDDRKALRAGAKYFEWERKGVPLRLDIGGRDIAANEAQISIRSTGTKKAISLNPTALIERIKSELASIQLEMLQSAKDRLRTKTVFVKNYDEMRSKLKSNEYGFYLAPWRCDSRNEASIKEDCKATIRCYPVEFNPISTGQKCFYSGEPATHLALFARAY